MLFVHVIEEGIRGGRFFHMIIYVLFVSSACLENFN